MLDYNEEVAKVEHLRDNPKIGLGGKPAVIVVDFHVVRLEQMLKYLDKVGAPATAGV